MLKRGIDLVNRKKISIKPVTDNISMIDLLEAGKERVTCSYLIKAEKLTLVETGPGPSGEIILQVLEQEGYTLKDLSFIVVTHIHLDHAGAAGYLIKKCPNATLVVHPRGARHMIDPHRLIEGASKAFDDLRTQLFPVCPVPQERIMMVEDEEVLDLGERKLTFYHGEGHAPHHMTIMDNLTKGLFSGDLLGLHFSELADLNIDFCLPSTAPPQFNPSAFLNSLEKIRQINPDWIFFSHYGAVKGLTIDYLDICRQGIMEHLQIVKEVCDGDVNVNWQKISRSLKTKIWENLIIRGFPPGKPLPEYMEQNIDLNAKGLLDWWEREQTN